MISCSEFFQCDVFSTEKSIPVCWKMLFYLAESIDFFLPFYMVFLCISRELLSRTDGSLQSITLSPAGCRSWLEHYLQGAGERGLWRGRGTSLEMGRDGRWVRTGVYGEGTVPGCWGLPEPPWCHFWMCLEPSGLHPFVAESCRQVSDSTRQREPPTGAGAADLW